MAGMALVTGGGGFIGCHLVLNLLRDGYDVTILDSLARPGSERNLAWLEAQAHNGHLDWVSGDVRDSQAVQRAASSVDVIYHLAAQVAVTSSVTDPRNDFEVNALGTLNVLEAARQGGRRPIVVYSSSGVGNVSVRPYVVIEPAYSNRGTRRRTQSWSTFTVPSTLVRRSWSGSLNERISETWPAM